MLVEVEAVVLEGQVQLVVVAAVLELWVALEGPVQLVVAAAVLEL